MIIISKETVHCHVCKGEVKCLLNESESTLNKEKHRRYVNVMCEITGSFRVMFESPFWIGVFERTENKKMQVCKVTFGAEPREPELYEFILKKYIKLKFGPAVQAIRTQTVKNPKRLQREIHRQVTNTEIGTKSQQALKKQQEQFKKQKKVESKEKKLNNEKIIFEIKQQKKKEKHRGR